MLKIKRKVELHSLPHQMKKNMKTPVRMKTMPCLVEILKSTSRKINMEEDQERVQQRQQERAYYLL